MKAQTRRGAAIETGVNLVVGFAANWIVNWVVLPWFGYPAHAEVLVTLGVIMTVVSIARQYSLRRIFEWLRIRKAPPEFLDIVEEIAEERLAQFNREGYDLAHDDQYHRGELQRAAAWYALSSIDHQIGPDAANFAEVINEPFITHPDYGWPWDPIYWKPTTERRDLVKAGALIIAAIGRHDRRVKQ